MPLIQASSLRTLCGLPGKYAMPAHWLVGRRVGGYKFISVQATPSTDSTRIVVSGKSQSASSPDAQFEVLGAPYSLLSVTLAPSQYLHTRRGTLVGLGGSSDSVVSTLQILNPLRRALIGIPFLYQKITSTSAISALISTKSPLTSFAILQLDGTTDWKIAQRKALLAWTGHTLSVTPTLSTKLSLAHWGSSDVTGRGLLALAGQGNVYTIELAQGETYAAHPSNVLAYSSSSPSPLPRPYRFRSSHVRFQIPLQLGNWFPSSNLVRNLKESDTYKFFAGISLRIKTWSRRTIWGDRLFLEFSGPTTILIQSRASRVSDVLTVSDVNEIADAPPGSVRKAIREAGATKSSDAARTGVEGATVSASTENPPAQQPKLTVASVSQDGKVSFTAVQNEKEVKP